MGPNEPSLALASFGESPASALVPRGCFKRTRMRARRQEAVSSAAALKVSAVAYAVGGAMDFESCREEEEEAGRAAAWHWIWRHICRERPDTGKRLNLLVSSTVLFSRGEPTLWVFTSKSGEVMRRMSDKLKPHIVRDQLAALSHAEPSNRRRYAGVQRSTYPEGISPPRCRLRAPAGPGRAP